MVKEVQGRKVVWYSDVERLQFWSELSRHLIQSFPEITGEYSKFSVQMAKAAFGFLVERFENHAKRQQRVAFYTYVYQLNEWASELNDMPTDLERSFSDADLATYRRVLKLVLEQSCKENLVVGPDVSREMIDSAESFDRYLGELIYLGTWIYAFAEYVAEMEMIGVVLKIRTELDGTVSLLPQQLTEAVRKYMRQDYFRHTDTVVLNKKAVQRIRLALFESLRVDYDRLGQVLSDDEDHPGMTWALMSLDMEGIARDTDAKEEDVRVFYAGLTLSKDNVLSVAESVLNPQHNQRMLYRPFLLLMTDVGGLYLTGKRMWRESIASMLTNALPYELGPQEWFANSGFRDFSLHLASMNDAVLEDAVEKMIAQLGYPYDRSVKSLLRPGQNNLIVNDKPGEMDFLVIDQKMKIIHVLECKHHRSRYDMVSWRKGEHNKFINVYEPKLKNKVKWVHENLQIVATHVTVKKHLKSIDVQGFDVRGAFVVNAPNLYLYNGQLDCFTLQSLNDLLRLGQVAATLSVSTDKGTVELRRPYFQSALDASID
jgi:hypothetical protein